MVNYRVESGNKHLENVMQSKASEAYKKTARVNNAADQEGGASFRKEYFHVLVRDYFYTGQRMEDSQDKLSHLKKLKASIDSLQLPADFTVSQSTEEISLENFVKLLEEEMAGFEKRKEEKETEEKIKEENRSLKELTSEEIEAIVSKAKGDLTLGDIQSLRRGTVKGIDRDELPREMTGQIREHLQKYGIDVTSEHEEIAKRLVEKGIELSEQASRNLDALLTAKHRQLSQDRIEELSKEYASVQKIDLREWNRDYPLSQKRVREVVEEIQAIGEKELPKIGTHFHSIEEALANYRGAGADRRSNEERNEESKSRISFQYIRYKMTMEKALALNSRGIAIDKAELATIEKELLRLEISAEQLEKTAAIRAVSQDDILTEMLHVEHGLLRIMGSDYGILPQMTTNAGFRHISGIALSHQATEAINRYDRLSTVVRSDLGDSMTKAFQRLHSLLLANGIEVNEANLRAAEILGRGRTEITSQTIETIKELDAKLQLVLRGLTPEATLQLMENGQDILAMSLEELSEYVDTRESRDLRRLSDRVAKKINRMETSGRINAQEKQQLILVYRLLHAIEKNEGGAVARLMKDDRPLTLENLYDTAKYLAGDRLIDESLSPETGFAENQNYTDLKEQIRSGFFYKKREIRDAFLSAEAAILSESAEEATETAKARFGLLRSYSLQEWEELFNAWQKPDVRDAEIYKQFQKIPFLVSDALRKLEKVSARSERARQKLERIKEVFRAGDSKEMQEQVMQILRDMEADVVAAETVEEKSILSALTETKQQWSYRQKLRDNRDFIQIPVWTGKELRQVNIYYPQTKRSEVHKQNEIKILLAFETGKNGKVSGFLTITPDSGEMILQTEDNDNRLESAKAEIVRLFQEQQIPLTSLSAGSFAEYGPYSDQTRGIREVKGREWLQETEKVLTDSTDIREVEQKMIALAKGLSVLFD